MQEIIIDFFTAFNAFGDKVILPL